MVGFLWTKWAVQGKQTPNHTLFWFYFSSFFRNQEKLTHCRLLVDLLMKSWFLSDWENIWTWFLQITNRSLSYNMTYSTILKKSDKWNIGFLHIVAYLLSCHAGCAWLLQMLLKWEKIDFQSFTPVLLRQCLAVADETLLLCVLLWGQKPLCRLSALLMIFSQFVVVTCSCWEQLGAH